LSFSLKIERFVSDSAEIWICGLYIELMNRPLEDYLQKKQRIRITGGVFRGKEGCIMRLHRNTRLVFAFGNMTVAVSYLHAFPFEKID